ncbi:MAG: PE-PPE domain-containing protein [Mycobacterium sp.]|nr:PE-PPE domain-containing protein [Mycobacterium sp.]
MADNGVTGAGAFVIRIATAAAAAAAVMGIALLATISTGVQLLANTLLVMGGNENTDALTPSMQQQLGGDPIYPSVNTDVLRPFGVFGQGYIDAENNPDSPYFGWDFTRVEWPAQMGLPILGEWSYEASQQQGAHNIDNAIAGVLPTLGPGEKAVAFGYSQSGNVMVREMRALQSQPGGAPATEQLEFFLLANPNRPNGGILQRFAGFYIPFFDIRVDGSTPTDTPYQTTDISWQYDGAADFPTYPLNLLAVLNSLIAPHGNYYIADVDGPRAFPDTTVGNITYITLKTPHLPLLMPLYYQGFPEPLLDLVEPALTVMVDWGYDRSISPGTPTTARLIPRVNPITAAVDLAGAVAQGVHDFIDGLTPTGPADKPASLSVASLRLGPGPDRGTAAASDRPAPLARRSHTADRRAEPPAQRSQRSLRAASR